MFQKFHNFAIKMKILLATILLFICNSNALTDHEILTILKKSLKSNAEEFGKKNETITDYCNPRRQGIECDGDKVTSL